MLERFGDRSINADDLLTFDKEEWVELYFKVQEMFVCRISAKEGMMKLFKEAIEKRLSKGEYPLAELSAINSPPFDGWILDVESDLFFVDYNPLKDKFFITPSQKCVEEFPACIVNSYDY